MFGIFISFVYLVSAVREISLSLDDSLIQNPDDLSVLVTFGDFGTVPTPVNLTFIISDESGIEYAIDNDFIVVTTEEVLRKKFKALFLPEGKYTLVLTTLYNVNVVDEFRAEFEIRKERRGITGRTVDFIGDKVNLLALLIFLGILIAGLIWWFVRKKDLKSRGKIK